MAADGTAANACSPSMCAHSTWHRPKRQAQPSGCPPSSKSSVRPGPCSSSSGSVKTAGRTVGGDHQVERTSEGIPPTGALFCNDDDDDDDDDDEDEDDEDEDEEDEDDDEDEEEDDDDDDDNDDGAYRMSSAW